VNVRRYTLRSFECGKDRNVSVPPLPFVRQVDGPHAGIGTLTLEQPGKPVIVLDEELLRRLEATIRTLPKDLRGLVVASASQRVFVAGADLRAIHDLPDDGLRQYLAYGAKVFAMLANLPYPTAAAINGAALGGGLELAMHCDALIGAPAPKPYPVGLPEAGLCICPGWGGTNLLPARTDPAEAIRRTAAGKPYLFDEAARAGLFDAVAPSAEALHDTACRWVAQARRTSAERDGAPLRWVGRPAIAGKVLDALREVEEEVSATDSGRAVVACVREGIGRGWEAGLETERRELIRLRNAPAGRAAIQAFFEKNAKR
jgi:enoyl-CoA hydratase/carnithine racemase